MELAPYIIFNGNCEEALNFYAKALGGQIKDLRRYEEAPPGEAITKNKQKVMHATFFANGLFFMASDAHDESSAPGKNGPIHLSINFDSVEEEEKIFNALSQGGKTTMPLQDTFWGARFGMLTDKFGISWMFNHDRSKK